MTLPDDVIQDDSQIQRIKTQLTRDFKKKHPRAAIDVYKRDEYSIRIRIVDPVFAGKDIAERETEVWKVLEQLPEETFSNISMLVLLTPEETLKSPANAVFENPPPVQL